MSRLFEPTTLGNLKLSNRIVMAPMTRSRAIGNVPNDLMAKYYGLRADAGLIVSEGASPSPNGLGYARIPGLFSAEQVKGWRIVTDAVHAGGGRIFVQLMHTGRVGHPANMPASARLLGPSAVAAPGEMWTDSEGLQPKPLPAEMTEADIRHAIGEYGEAARLAVQAGFDGVELHGANGYLIDQFLNAASNRRSDGWGGSVENRIRFAVEVARAASKSIGAERVGMRISPYGASNGMAPDPETDALYVRLAEELSRLGLVYLHMVDHSSTGAPPVPAGLQAKIRGTFRGAYVLSGGYDRARADADLAEGKGDLVAFGRPFIANPDLVTRLGTGAALAAPDPKTFYTPGEKGYTDYGR
jgi:N-ethylmaleimide reductase